MYKLPHNTVDSAFKPFAPLISTSNAMINQIINIFENAEYNKKICNVFLDRVDVAKIHIKNLERRKEENEHIFRDDDYHKHFERFTTILLKIKEFLSDITHPGYNKYNSAKNFEKIFEDLTQDIDTVMGDLKFTTIAPEEQKKIDQQSLKESYETMKEVWKVVDDNKQMNTSLQKVNTIKTQVESKGNQGDNNNTIKATQIPPNMLQDPEYKKSSDFRGERPYYICKKNLKNSEKVACRYIIIHDLSDNEYQKIQKQLAILEKLHDSKNILIFYGLSTVVVLEWAEMGNLDNVYNNYVTSWPDKVSIALGICHRLIFLYSCKILHHDICCGNIMITKKKEPNFDVQGAPESLSCGFKQYYNFKYETFSFGMLLLKPGFERIHYEKWDMRKIKLQKEYSNIFTAWRNDSTIRSSFQHIFLKLNNLTSTYGKNNENVTSPKKERNSDGVITHSKHSVSIGDDDKEFLKVKQTNKPDSIMPIIPENTIKLFQEAADENCDAQLHYMHYMVDDKNADKDLFIKYLRLSADNGNTTA
ncbi:14187_t:CDS:2 [Entrophospora sp. SA101]|nr:6222_t:CDS:2 [Entrophospora sp. SA101]CAJ0897825.1 13490_t:CDS:2 [Entrophospora sp. SA101]CAJ0914400.1 14187_t:CDS:2 [Entrophospora sp. SA101]